MTSDGDEQVEVFRAGNAMAAQAAIDEVLEPNGIEGVLHDRSSHVLPTPAAQPGDYFVAVPGSLAKRAAELLREAISDGALDGTVSDGN
jgi:hypothetical protein